MNIANAKTKSLTEGSILKALILFALPILIGNIFQQLYNVADTAIIGNILGDKSLAAVGAAAPVCNLLIGFAGGLTNGFAVIIARYFGADNEHMMRKAVALTYLLSAAIAVILTAAGLIGLHPLMSALNTPSDIIADTEGYMAIIIGCSVFTIGYNMLAGMMRAIGNSRAPLYFLTVSSAANIGLDLLFIKVFDMGVRGAAIATVISQALSVALCFIYAKKKCGFLIFDKAYLKRDRPLTSDLAATGLSMGLMYAIVSVGSVILQGAVNSLGTDIVTSHTAARRIDDIFMQPIATVSMSSATFSGQNFGAGKIDRVRKGVKCGIGIAVCWSVFTVIITLLFGKPLIQAITGTASDYIISSAMSYITLNTACFFILSALVVLRSSLQGVGRKIVPVSASGIEMILKIFASSLLAPALGYFGICITEPIIWLVCAAVVAVDYFIFVRKSAAAT